jgi:hypothetical protein
MLQLFPKMDTLSEGSLSISQYSELPNPKWLYPSPDESQDNVLKTTAYAIG